MSETNAQTETGPVAVAATPGKIEIDPQNPLPEGSWFWRRVITIGITACTMVAIWHILQALHDLQDSASLLTLAKWIIGFDVIVLTYYFIGPSAAELVNMIQTSKIIQSGMEMAQETARRVGFPGRGGRFPVAAPPQPVPVPATPSGPEIDAAPRSRT